MGVGARAQNPEARSESDYQVRFITRPKSRTMSRGATGTRQLLLPPTTRTVTEVADVTGT